MLGLKNFRCARAVIAGIETMHMIKKGAARPSQCPSFDRRIPVLLAGILIIDRSPGFAEPHAAIATEPANEHPWLIDLLVWSAKRSPRRVERMAGVLGETHIPTDAVTVRGVLRRIFDRRFVGTLRGSLNLSRYCDRTLCRHRAE